MLESILNTSLDIAYQCLGGYVSLSQKIYILARKHASIIISAGESVKGIIFFKNVALAFLESSCF